MRSEDVGRYFQDANGKVWQCIAYCDEPTVTLKRVDTLERVSGAVGSRILAEFVRLSPERPPPAPDCDEEEPRR